MASLNYHHLRYFRAIAHAGNLSRAALNLNISQSALSIQLRELERALGEKLFERKNRRLILTEAGRMTLDYADVIFRTGDELVDTLKRRSPGRRQVVRIGAVATLSRNFQHALLSPLLNRPNVELVVRSGSMRELIAALQAHSLDMVLSNLPLRPDAQMAGHSHLISQQAAALIGQKPTKNRPFHYPDDLRTVPLIVPSLDSSVRALFDVQMDRLGIRPVIAAEVDDMATLRLLARDHKGLTLVPPVVVRGELAAGTLVERYRLDEITESFYAITVSRRFPNALVREIISRPLKI
jgi:LysR family transcriptional activator of nhaA